MKKCTIILMAVLLMLSLIGCGSPSAEFDTTFPQAEVESSDRSMESGEQEGESTQITDPALPEENKSEDDQLDALLELVPADDEFVRVVDYIPNIVIDLKYATEDNFTDSAIYDFSDAYLRYGTVIKLAEVQAELESMGMGLKIWDAFRPVSAQFRLWDICPDATYVANPYDGFSSHSRGNTVDVTLICSDGTELQMPTEFDDFTQLADRDYSDCDELSASHAELLEELMIKHDFKPYSGEWWHFTDNTFYEVDKEFEPPILSD